MQTKTKTYLSHVMVILNLLFPMVYPFILIHWFQNKKSPNDMVRISVKEALILATISTIVFVAIVISVLFYFGFNSTFTLIAGEIYYMVLVPLFFVPAILGITKTNSDQVYRYPVIGKFCK
ncbi:MAG TPA: DUF4870 domain-containing protein [Gammaproteobacteria bacterium]|nr:DUF4870 domain-containing protein [Xanthomonadales bacterium]HOP22841.1 DUF4870 domain-containing protein [Gammaproteobacteria bacterium]MCB1594656.1 DUF4870 domain-containing protein [Xanthomonadales bacterium]MCB1604161.1 DUF4870 domain-containing protein [Xanthomonadales bacterium]HPI96701.1 DUF4870 domain-containing protein [Gammaproteobacteria bacterium]